MRSFNGALAAVVAVAALAGAASAQAATAVYSADPGLLGNQNWNGTLGLDFDVLASVEVTQLGAFDSNGDGIGSDIFVTIRDAEGANLVTPLDFKGAANPTHAAYIFQDIAPLILTPGRYQVSAWQYNSADPNFNFGFIQSGDGGPIHFDSLGGRLSAVGTRYANFDQPGGLTTNQDNGKTRYGAGSFAAVAVPEPTTWALMIAGFGGVGAMLRRRRPSVAAALA